MGVQLPSKPITRKEQYLAKAAGQAVEVPAEPITREEAYLNAIAHGGGGGGTDDYNDLKNQPQINGNTLIGNKTASDLGLVAAEAGKGLSSNDYTNEDKAIVGSVTAALAGKQDVLTAGEYINIENNKISVKRDISKEDSRVVVNVYGHNDSVIDVTVTQDGEQISSETYSLHTLSTVNIANVAELYTPRYPFIAVRNLVDSTEHPAGYVEEMWMGSVPRYEQTYIVKAYEDKKLITQSELDAEIDAIKDGANIDSFADVETALALKQDKTDNALQTTDKTVVGAINEHEGDIDSLKSGLTNVDVALSVPENTGKNVLPLTMDILKAKNTSGTWVDNVYTQNGVAFTVNTDSAGNVISVTANGTASADSTFYYAKGVTNTYNGYKLNGCTGGSSSTYYLAVSLNASPWTTNTNYRGDTNITIANGTGIEVYTRIKSGYEASDVTFVPMIRPATITDPTFAPYIPSVDARLDAVESGVAGLTTTFKVEGSATDLSLWANDNGVVVLSTYIAAIDKRVGFKRAADGTISSYESD